MQIGVKEWMKDPAGCMERIRRYNSKRLQLDYGKMFRNPKFLSLLEKGGYTVLEDENEFKLIKDGKVERTFKKEKEPDATR